jgi:hypothetical protein
MEVGLCRQPHTRHHSNEEEEHICIPLSRLGDFTSRWRSIVDPTTGCKLLVDDVRGVMIIQAIVMNQTDRLNS